MISPQDSVQLSTEIVSEFAAHAIINYNNLHDAAESLYEKGYFGLSRSTAIAAQEEYGKVIGAMGFLCGIIPERKFRSGLRSHIRKLIWARSSLELASGMLPLMPATTAAVSKDTDEIVQQIASDVASLDEASILSSGLVAELGRLGPLITAIDNAEFEKRRQAGLYVNIGVRDGKHFIEHPGLIDQSMAVEQLDLIRKFRKTVDSVAGGPLFSAQGITWLDDASARELGALLLRIVHAARKCETTVS